jgi:hypothetical protein
MQKLFLVPEDLFVDFAGKLAEKDLANEIKGVNEDGDIQVTVHYDADQRYDVFELTEWLENLEFEEIEDEDY